MPLGAFRLLKLPCDGRVMLGVNEARKASKHKPRIKYSYGYTVNGRDLGLQRYPRFRQVVTGVCATEYNWITSGAGGIDEYQPWGFQNYSAEVHESAEDRDPPYLKL